MRATFGCIALVCLGCFEIVISCGVETEVMNGILGKPFYLRSNNSVPGTSIMLKRLESGNIKTNVLHYDFRAHEDLLNNSSVCRYCFDESKEVIKFADLQKEDEGVYEWIRVDGRTEHTCKWHIKVYEQITSISINQTTHHHNDTCVVTLTCTTPTKDVTFSWNRTNEDLPHNSSILEIHLTSDDAQSSYTCTVKNPVSERSTTVTPFMGCASPPEQSQTMLYVALSVVSVAVLVPIILFFVLRKEVLCRHKKTGTFTVTGPERAPVPEPQTPKVETIYATVDKKPPENLSSAADTSMTIYELAGHSLAKV